MGSCARGGDDATQARHLACAACRAHRLLTFSHQRMHQPHFASQKKFGVEMINPGLPLDAFDVDALVHLARALVHLTPALVLLGFSGIC